MYIILGLIGIVLAIITLLKGSLPSIGLKTRKVGAVVLCISIIALCAGVYLAGVSSSLLSYVRETIHTFEPVDITDPFDTDIFEFYGKPNVEEFTLQVGSTDFTVNEEDFILNAPFVELEGSSYIPLKFFLDWFGAEKMYYDAKKEKVTFTLSRYENVDPDIIKKYRAK